MDNLNEANEMPKQDRRRPIIPGILLILLGLWLLGRQLNLPFFAGEVSWPWLIFLLGVVIWVRYIFFPPRNSENVFWGTVAVLTGAFLISWYNGLLLSELEGWGDLWPIIPLILGISALVEWLFAIRKWGTLIFGIAAGALGSIGLAYTSGRISLTQAMQILNLWPVLIVLAGLGLLLQAILNRRSSS